MTLADRIEALDGPDREVDALIWCALHGVRYRHHWQAHGAMDTQVEFTTPPQQKHFVSGSSTYPHAGLYTASLDAAMTLVPEGCAAIHSWQYPDYTHYAIFGDEDGDLIWFGRAKTPALALAAAAIRAREVG